VFVFLVHFSQKISVIGNDQQHTYISYNLQNSIFFQSLFCYKQFGSGKYLTLTWGFDWWLTHLPCGMLITTLLFVVGIPQGK